MNLIELIKNSTILKDEGLVDEFLELLEDKMNDSHKFHLRNILETEIKNEKENKAVGNINSFL